MGLEYFGKWAAWDSEQVRFRDHSSYSRWCTGITRGGVASNCFESRQLVPAPSDPLPVSGNGRMWCDLIPFLVSLATNSSINLVVGFKSPMSTVSNLQRMRIQPTDPEQVRWTRIRR
jgi:hypothetical protein